LLALLRELNDQSVQPVVAFTGPGICVDEYARAGIDVRVLDLPQGTRAYGKQWLAGSVARRLLRLVGLYPAIIREAWRVIAAVQPDVVHCNEPRALFTVGLAARLRGIPVVLHLRGSVAPYPQALRTAIELIPHRIIAVGPSIRAELGSIGRRKARVVYNPIPMPAPQPRSRDGRPVVLTLASIIPHKGHHHLLEAARLLRERTDVPQPEFRIRGQVLDPAYEQELKRRISELGLDNVDLRDWTADVARELRMASVVVSTSVQRERLRIGDREVVVENAEGTSRQVLEALAAGVPVIASRVPGSADIIEHERTGLLVTPGKPGELADALIRMLSRPDGAATLAQAGRDVVAQRHAPARSAAAVAALYDQLLH
jgi:glycosyltransferase involved in cell wall biosynthesis